MDFNNQVVKKRHYQLCGYRKADPRIVFAYEKGRFSHDGAQMISLIPRPIADRL